ncbi:MAG TPA: biotin--[acetyl-CoA-carboxylase] ligase [Candidatus Pullichristensenella avicola]|nr:biotin--[acetyl-CoA-carboxylase] ligase [Candidatus Pullichristensenella avicola]
MREIFTFDAVDSTNAVAKRMALSGAGERAVMAAEQTAGRGRLARRWASARGEGLWVSLLLRPQAIPAAQAGGAVFVSALAMAEALCRYGPAKIKWPNDLVMGGKKLCGMLAEAGFRGGMCDWIVLGVGVNLLQTAFAADLPHATSLFLQTGARLTPGELLPPFLERFEAWYARWQGEGLAPILEGIRPLSATLGRRIQIEGREGVALDFREDGALIWQTGGKTEAVLAGDVSVRGLYGYV